MLRRELQQQRLMGEMLQLKLKIGFVQRKLAGQRRRHADDLIHVVDDLHPPEDDHAGDVLHPVARLGVTCVIHAVGHLVAAAEGVLPVSAVAAVEPDAAGFGIVPVVHGHAVGIAVVALHGQHAARQETISIQAVVQVRVFMLQQHTVGL